MEQVIFFDTTMRDGRQCPGAWLTDDQYMKYIELADSIGFDQIEAWFPSSSTSEWKQVHTVATMAWNGQLKATIAWLCQLKQDQVEKTILALQPAKDKWLLHVYFPVDPQLLAASVGEIDKDEICSMVEKYVRIATLEWLQVQFSPEWYSRMWENFDFCTDLIRAAVRGGASYINCPDTIWWASHYEWSEYYVENMKRHKTIIDREFPNNSVIWSIHNHNDLWNAVENSIWWVVNWVARKIEWTIWWVGERAWNADLLQIIMNLKMFHGKQFDISHIDTTWFAQIWSFVGETMLGIQSHYPIIWKNSFRHTSGGHVNALLRDPLVYHPYLPQTVGGEISLVFWPQSWWNHAKEIIEKFWFICWDNEKSKIAQFIKDIYVDRYKWVNNQEVLEAYFSYRLPIHIESYEKQWKTFTISWDIFGESSQTFSGTTAFSWLKNFLDQKLGLKGIETKGFENREEGEWVHATAVAKVSVHDEDISEEWYWQSEDIELASMKALVHAYKKYYSHAKFSQSLSS